MTIDAQTVGMGEIQRPPGVLQLGVTEKDIKFLGFVPQQDTPICIRGLWHLFSPHPTRALAFLSLKPRPPASPLWHPTVSSIPEVVLGAQCCCHRSVPKNSLPSFASVLMPNCARPL